MSPLSHFGPAERLSSRDARHRARDGGDPRDHTSIQGLSIELAGQAIAPDDADYESARQVFCRRSIADPQRSSGRGTRTRSRPLVGLAQDQGLELAVRSGGHSAAGHGVSDGGIVLDLSRMKALEIDPDERVAWAETGLTAGELTAPPRRMGSRSGSATPARSGSAA